MKTKNIYADPTIDFAFKRIFGTERFKDATIGLLNSIIKDVNIVEMQNAKQVTFMERMVYYTAKVIARPQATNCRPARSTTSST